jgi:formyl-CoA transferase
MGAEVVRVDDPRSGDPTFNAPPYLGAEGASFERRSSEDVGLAYLKRARGKKAISLDLKSKKGLEIFFRLVAWADVLVENFKVGVTERLGIDYPVLQKINPRLVYCSITGYGSSGPERRRKAFDLMVQAATGLMSITGEPDGPPSKTGSSLSDGIAGTFALAGVLGALLQRQQTGRGQFVDVSMADCLVSLIFDEPFDSYDQLGLSHRQGNRIARFSPFNTFVSSDGSVAIGAGTNEDWGKLLRIMGREDLLVCERHMSPGWRLANNAEVESLVDGWTRQHTTRHIIDILDKAEITCGPIRSVAEVVEWDHLRERGMFQRLKLPHAPDNGPVAAGFPIKFSSGVAQHSSDVPKPREHNREIFGGLLGMSCEEIDTLTASGVI